MALINLTADETVAQTIAQSQEIPLLGKFIIPSAMTSLQLRSWTYCPIFFTFPVCCFEPMLRIRSRNPGLFWPLDRIRIYLSVFRIPDPTHISESLVTIFGLRTLKFAVNWLTFFFFTCSKNLENLNVVNFMATQNRENNIFFSFPLFFVVVWSGIHDLKICNTAFYIAALGLNWTLILLTLLSQLVNKLSNNNGHNGFSVKTLYDIIQDADSKIADAATMILSNLTRCS